jgi:hypothetical protein
LSVRYIINIVIVKLYKGFCLLCFLLIFAGSCTDMNTIIYRYADGSGNIYIINKTMIEYVPVKPSFSSSGIYDGGEHSKKKLSTQEYDSITGLLDKAAANTSVHIETRLMGSGYIKITKHNSTRTVILKPDSEEQHAIEKALKTIIEKR